jgi:hypothetical protein
MPDEVTFDDLLALTKIKEDTTVEKFGGQINSHFYDGANILGTLSQKKLVQLPTGSIGQNPVVLGELGTQLLNEAISRSNADLDNLDLTILVQIKNGRNKSADIAKAINIRPRDLAMHLYKLQEQNYTTSEFKNGIVILMLTEQGFSQAASGVLPSKQPPQAAVMAASQPQNAQTMQMTTPPQTTTPQTPQKPAATPPPVQTSPQKSEDANGSKWKLIIVVVVVIVILLGLGYAIMNHIITV